MSERLLALAAASAAGRVWVDGADYCARLFSSGTAPWQSVGAGIDWLRKSQQLLRSDVLLVDGLPFLQARRAAPAGGSEGLEGVTSPVEALRRLLADGALREHLREWLDAARSSFAGHALCLRLPTPRRALDEAVWLARPDTVPAPPQEDDIDDAALYLADFLRCLSGIALDGLLLSESAAAATDADTQALYQSVFNVAAAYRWAVGLELPPGHSDGTLHRAFDFAIADRPLDRPTVRRVPASCWSGALPAHGAGPCFLAIPPEAPPERVLDVLGALRS